MTPASDGLAAQSVFIPQDGAVPLAYQSQLTQLMGSATRAGFPVRVALIAGRSAVGSVTTLWRRPSAYARFLAQELSEVFRGTLLVVMPNASACPRRSGSGGCAFWGAGNRRVAWLAFAGGAILIAVAWTISLRQRPPRRRDGVASPHGN